MWLEWSLATAMLAGASIHDVTNRRIPNAYWLPWLWPAATLWIIYADPAAILALLVIPAYYALWRLKAYGGGDLKALALVTLIAPQSAPWGLTLSLDALTTAVLLALATAPLLPRRIPFIAYITVGAALAPWTGNIALRLIT